MCATTEGRLRQSLVWSGLFVFLACAALAGCFKLPITGKDACRDSHDCLSGYACVARSCRHVEQQRDAGSSRDSGVDGTAASQEAPDSATLDGGLVLQQGPDSATLDSGLDDDAMTPDAGPQLPLHVDCGKVAANQLPLGVKLFTSIAELDVFAARDGVLYGTRYPARPLPVTQWWRVSQPLGQVESLEPVLPGGVTFNSLVFDGSELFFGCTTASLNRVVGKLALSDKTELNLARESSGNVTAVAVDGASVYWTSNDGAGSAGVGFLSRSDRIPGATETLWSGSGTGPQPVWGSLHVLGDFIYFALGADTYTQIYRIRRDRSAPAEVFGTSIPGLYALISDGQNLFAAGFGTTDRLGNPVREHEVAQVSLVDGSLKPLFQVLNGGRPIADSAHLYWLAADSGGLVNSLWVARSDGTGAAVEVAVGGAFSALVQDSASLYLALDCNGTSHVLVLDKRVAAP